MPGCMSNFRMMRKFWQYEWMNILFVMYILKIQVIQTVNIRHKKQSYEMWSIKKLDMSTARRRFKSPRSLYGTSTHPTMLPIGHSHGHEWLTHIPFDPCQSHTPTTHPIPPISLFQTLTLKLQGQSHGWGQRWRSHSSPSIQPMHLLLLSHQSDQPFLRYVQ